MLLLVCANNCIKLLAPSASHALPDVTLITMNVVKGVWLFLIDHYNYYGRFCNFCYTADMQLMYVPSLLAAIYMYMDVAWCVCVCVCAQCEPSWDW